MSADVELPTPVPPGRDAFIALVLGLPLLLPPDTFPAVRPIALFLVALALARRPGIAAPRGASLLAAFVAISALSISWSARPGPGLESLLDLLLAGGLAVLATGVGMSSLQALAAGLCIVHGLLAVWQRLVLLPGLARALESATDARDLLLLQRASGGRAFSTLALPGHLGVLLLALAPLLVAAATGPGSRLLRSTARLAIVALGAGLLASSALGATAAAGLVTLVWVAGPRLHAPARRRALLLLSVLVLAGAALVAGRAGELASSDPALNPLRARLRLWDRGFQVLAAAPVTGEGLGSYAVAWLPFARTGDVPAGNAHMSYLEIAAECGIPALTLLLAFFGAALAAPARDPVRLGALILLVHAAVDFDLQSPALLSAAMVLAGSAAMEVRRPLAPRLRAALAAVALAAGGAAALRESARPDGPGLAALPPGERAEALARSIRRWPLDASARGERARALLAAGQPDGALREVQAARALEPRTAWLAGLEADVRVVRAEAFGAYFAYRDAHRLFPARPDYVEQADALAERIRSVVPGPPPPAP